MFYILAALFVACILALVYKARRPRRIRFYGTGAWQSRAQLLPNDFEIAWACLEATTKPVSFPAPRHCPICGKHAEDRYTQHYRLGKFVWSGLERHHMMHNHVQYGDDGYYLPPPDFVEAVMQAYAATNTSATLQTAR